jgi:hypothetical protein
MRIVVKREKTDDMSFPQHHNSSIEGTVEEFPLCHDKDSSEGVSTLPHRINTNYICLLTLCGPVANLLAFGSLNVRTGSQLFGF